MHESHLEKGETDPRCPDVEREGSGAVGQLRIDLKRDFVRSLAFELVTAA